MSVFNAFSLTLLSSFSGFVIGVVAVSWIRDRKSKRLPLVIYFKHKDLHCDVWSPQLPGCSAVGGHLAPALISYLRQHGEKLNIRLVEEPPR